MCINRAFLCVLIFIATGCCRRVSMHREFGCVQTEVMKRTQQAICTTDYLEPMVIDDQFPHGLSRDGVVSLALENNPELQASFDDLGIAKADLVNAGFYTNPQVGAFFNLKRGNAQRADIQWFATARVSDLWLVPLGTCVADDVLNVVSQRVLQTVLRIIRDTKKAYNECLQAEAQLKNAVDAAKKMNDIVTMHEYYFKYGYGDELLIINSKAAASQLEAAVYGLTVDVENAFRQLKKQMGSEPTSARVPLTSSLCDRIVLDSAADLESYALDCSPEVLIGTLKVKQYRDQISLEKGRVFDDVNLGVSYERDFEKKISGFGPAFQLSVPIFNQNEANVARACYQMKQAEKELVGTKLDIQQRLRAGYCTIDALLHQIVIYEDTILPTREKAYEWSEHYLKQMQQTIQTLGRLPEAPVPPEVRAELLRRFRNAKTKSS